MRRVVATALADRTSGQPARGRDKSRVEDGQSQNGKRGEDGKADVCRARRRVEDCGRREQKPEHQTAGVAHEHAGRMEVVHEKADRCAGCRRPNQRDGDVLWVRRDRQRRTRDRRDPGGEAVHVVHQVHGVHESNDPQNRHDECDRLERDDLNPHSAEEETGRDDRLSSELRRRGHSPEIIEEPEGKGRCDAGDDHRRHPRCREYDHESNEDRESHGGAAKKRRGSGMPTIGARSYDQSKPSGYDPERGSGDGREHSNGRGERDQRLDQ